MKPSIGNHSQEAGFAEAPGYVLPLDSERRDEVGTSSGLVGVGGVLTHLDLFSGIGGFSIAARWAGFETVAFAEIEPDACALLAYWWPDVPNLGDVRKLTTQDYDRPDLLTGGVPCQPASLIGKRRGTADERWLWPDAIRIVGRVRPRFAVFENPPALLTLESGGAFNRITAELSALGYDCWWDVIPACAVGAGHQRERLLLIAADADDKHGREQQQQQIRQASRAWNEFTGGDRTASHGDSERRIEARERLPKRASHGHDIRGQSSASHRGQASHGHDARLEGHAGNGNGSGRPQPLRPTAPESLRGVVSRPDWWREDVTGIPVLVHGIPARLAEAYHRCIGNAVVPQAVFPVINGVAALLTGGGGAEQARAGVAADPKGHNAKLTNDDEQAETTTRT